MSLCPMIDINKSDIRSILFKPLYDYDDNLLKLKEQAQLVIQKDLMKRLFLVKINQNFDLKSSNIYRNIAEQVGISLFNEQIQESAFFDLSELPNFYKYIEEKEQKNKFKRSSSFSSDLDSYNEDQNKTFYEIQNTFFGRIPLYVKTLLSGKNSFELHNSLNRIIFMELNPFDLSTTYFLINETCKFVKCNYALNLFHSIQDYNCEVKLEKKNSRENICNHDALSQNSLAGCITCLNQHLFSELVHSILLGTQLNEQIIKSFTRQQIYFAFFLISHITKISVLSFAMGVKNELDLGYVEQKNEVTTQAPPMRGFNAKLESREDLVFSETIFNQIFNKQSTDQFQFDTIREECKPKKFSDSDSQKNLDQSTDSMNSQGEEDEDEMSCDSLLEQKVKYASRYSNIVGIQQTEYQEFFISSIEPFVNCRLLQVIDESYKYLKYNEPRFQQECGISKDALLGYVQCLLNIKNYQFNPKSIDELPQEIKNYIKCLVYNPHRIDRKLVDGVRKYLPSFDLYSEFAEYLAECSIFTNLSIFQNLNNL